MYVTLPVSTAEAEAWGDLDDVVDADVADVALEHGQADPQRWVVGDREGGEAGLDGPPRNTWTLTTSPPIGLTRAVTPRFLPLPPPPRAWAR